MPLWLQNLLVILLVLASLSFIARQAWNVLAGRRSKLGSCCDKGCGAAATTSSKPKSEKIVFLPVEMLGRKK